jgi:hypothetical protein
MIQPARSHGYHVHRDHDGLWTCRAWDGLGRVVEVTHNASRMQALAQAQHELDQMNADEGATAP